MIIRGRGSVRAIHPHLIGAGAATWILIVALLVVSCGGDSPATGPGQTGRAAVRFAYLASTSLRSDLPPSAQSCAAAVGRTHIHPSWRSFERIDMQAVGPNRWEIGFDDVPVGARQSIRISDGNVCTENPTGAATRNVQANGVVLSDIVPTPGSGTEPGLAFSVDAAGRVTP